MTYKKSIADMMLDDLMNAKANAPDKKATITVWVHGKLTGGDDAAQFSLTVKVKNIFVDENEGLIFTRTKKKGRVTYKSLPIQDIRKVKLDVA